MNQGRMKEVPMNHLAIYLLIGYVLTGGMLFVLAFILYKWQISEEVVDIAILGIYIICAGVIGWMAGKKVGCKKFIWGCIMGIIYFMVLFIVSLLVNHTLKDIGNNFFTTFVICAGSGMLGGMIS